ncbi:MAG: peptidylprolyl isomerase [Candidatus Woesearchaeota archaeon]|nr:MAG: peptidylprolyl isomerase [Candidatus Woesearchaeota archaeon]
MQIKNGDFIEIEYIAKIKGTDKIFDLTSESLAKEKGLFDAHRTYGSVIICLGKNQILAGLDKKLEGKESSSSYTIDLTPEEAFGKKDIKLIKVYSTKKFIENKVNPMPGLQVDMDGLIGIIRSVSSGRTTVDFNHPLAGKEVTYEVKINKVVTDVKEKLENFIKFFLNIKDAEVKIEDKKAEIKTKQKIPDELSKFFVKRIAETIDEIKEVKFIL